MTRIKAGHTVRIRPEYGDIFDSEEQGDNQVGTEFVVTNVVTAPYESEDGDTEYVTGDPQDWGIWISYVERVQ